MPSLITICFDCVGRLENRHASGTSVIGLQFLTPLKRQILELTRTWYSISTRRYLPRTFYRIKKHSSERKLHRLKHLKQHASLLASLKAQIHPNCTCTCKRLPCATKVVIVHTRTECVTKFSKSIFFRLFHQLAFRFEILIFAHHKVSIKHQNFLFVRSKNSNHNSSYGRSKNCLQKDRRRIQQTRFQSL